MMMKTMCVAHLGVLLLLICLFSPQVVQAQNTTSYPMTSSMSSHTIAPTPTGNVTSKDKNGCGRTDAFPLLLPLALAASLLHGWS